MGAVCASPPPPLCPPSSWTPLCPALPNPWIRSLQRKHQADEKRALDENERLQTECERLRGEVKEERRRAHESHLAEMQLEVWDRGWMQGLLPPFYQGTLAFQGKLG